MKLYINPISPNSRKVMAVASSLQLDCEVELVDLAKGENRTPEFLKINPNAKIPALVDGDFMLWESNAIIAYLCSKKDTELWPKSNVRYDVMRWMNWELAHWGRWISTYGYETFLKGILGGGPPDEKILEESARFIKKFATVLDKHLAGQKFLTGDTVTIADFAVAAHLTYRIPAKLPLDEFKNITAWEEALNQIPAWKESAPQR